MPKTKGLTQKSARPEEIFYAARHLIDQHCSKRPADFVVTDNEGNIVHYPRNLAVLLGRTEVNPGENLLGMPHVRADPWKAKHFRNLIRKGREFDETRVDHPTFQISRPARLFGRNIIDAKGRKIGALFVNHDLTQEISRERQEATQRHTLGNFAVRLGGTTKPLETWLNLPFFGIFGGSYPDTLGINGEHAMAVHGKLALLDPMEAGKNDIRKAVVDAGIPAGRRQDVTNWAWRKLTNRRKLVLGSFRHLPGLAEVLDAIVRQSKGGVEPQVIEWGNIASDVHTTLKHELPEGVTVKISQHDPEGHRSLVKLHDASDMLHNLIYNAARAAGDIFRETQEPQVVQVRISRANGKAVISVTNKGDIPEQLRPGFGREAGGHMSANLHRGGSGTGAAATSEMAMDNSGTFNFETGHGNTTVRIAFPEVEERKIVSGK